MQNLVLIPLAGLEIQIQSEKEFYSNMRRVSDHSPQEEIQQICFVVVLVSEKKEQFYSRKMEDVA